MSAKLKSAAVVTCGVGFLICSCAQFKRTDVKPHWVHDQRLREVMQEVNTEMVGLVLAPVPTLDGDTSPSARLEQSREEAFDRVCDLARSLALSADDIAKITAQRKMPAADRAAFLASVDTLREQALRLKKLANVESAEGVQLAFNEIDATCNSCHTRFRDYSGELASR